MVSLSFLGRPITEVYSRWYKSQPENLGGNENCVHMDLQRSMNDYKCDSKAHFICKKSNRLLEQNNNCTLPDLGKSFFFILNTTVHINANGQ